MERGLKPFFTVVIPTYNSVGTLGQCLNSVFSQTYSNYEILIVDDGSTDDTSKFIAGINDTRIKYCWQKNSGGPASPRNLGIQNATGSWIAFLDADDTWKENKLECVSDFIKNNNIYEIICHNEDLYLKNIFLKESIYFTKEIRDYKNLLMNGNKLSPSAVVVSLNFINSKKLRFNEIKNYRIVEDYDFWLMATLHGAKIGYINKSLGEYRLGNDNISNNHFRAFKNLKSLVYDHVYFQQCFCKNKNQLWNKLCVKIYLDYSFLLLSKSGNSSKSFLIFMYFIKKHTKETLRYILKKCYVKIISIIK